MERRRFLGNFQPHSRNRDHPYEGGTVVFTVTTGGKWTYAIDQSKTDWFTHPTVDGMTLAILIPEKHREQGALRRGPVHLGLGPHAGRGVHHHAGTRTRTARTTESRPARRGLPRRRHGRGRVAAQERGALLPRNGADLLLSRRLQAHRDQLHAPPGQNTRKDSYYRVDYYTNETFKNGLDDGHTLEVVFRSNENKGTAEYKPFAAHQAGGTGFLICKEGQGGHPACITFLPNVSTTGKSSWIWAQSDVYPEIGRYYHVVGVWDKKRGKSLHLRGRRIERHGRRSGQSQSRLGRRALVRRGRRLGGRLDGQRMERRGGSGPRLRRCADRGTDRPALQGCDVRRPDPRGVRPLEPHLPDQVRDRHGLHLHGLRQRFRSRRQGEVHLGGRRNRSIHGRRRVHRKPPATIPFSRWP